MHEMNIKEINILLVEDDPGDCRLVKLHLSRTDDQPASIKVSTAGSLAEAIKAVGSACYDMVLLDLNLPDSRGIETIRTLLAANSSVPIIVLTGLSDDETGLQAISEGAEDYLVKGQSLQHMLVRSIRYAIERRHVRFRLDKSEEKYANLTENLNQIVYSSDPETLTAKYVNRAVEEICGYSKQAWLSDPSLWENTIYPDDRERVFSEFKKLRKETKDGVVEYRIVRKDGNIRRIEDNVNWEKNEKGEVVSINGIMSDVTERKQAEGRQKLTSQILNLLNNSGGKNSTILGILLLVKEFTGFDAVGIRLKEGEDFPYYETSGFSADFVQAEKHICARDAEGALIRSPEGNVCLGCMCGAVIGRCDGDTSPFFTEAGSFWTNSTTKFFGSVSKEKLPPFVRGRCHAAGYESIALIPLCCDKEIIGLIQLNSKCKGMLTEEIVRFFEEIGASIGIALGRKRANDQLQEKQKFLEAVLSNIHDGIVACDSNGKVTFVNHAAFEFHGLPSESTSLDQWAEHRDAYLSDGQTMMRKEDNPLYRALKGEQVRNMEMVISPKQGKPRTLLANGQPLIDGNGQKIGAVVATHDFTAYNNAVQALRESEQRLRLHFQQTALGVIEWDMESKVAKWNPAASQIFGYSGSEAIGCHASLVVPPHASEQFDSVWKELFQHHASVQSTIPNVTKDGRTIFCEWYNTSLADADGKVVGVASFIKDITEHNKAEIMLRESEERYRRITNTVTDYIYTVHYGDGLPVGAVHSESCVAVTGYTSKEFNADPYLWHDMIYPDDHEAVYEQISRCIAEENIKDIEHRIIRKDGAVRWIRSTMVRHLNASGQLLSYDGLLKDITDYKDIELKKQAAEMANQAKSEFLANMSHELRTPLHAILSFSGFGIKKYANAGPEKLLDYFTRIRQSGKGLLGLVNDLLDLAKLESNKMPFTFVPTGLDALIKSIVDELSSLMSERNLEVQYENNAFLEEIVFDAERMRQVFRNLLANAIKFSPVNSSINVTVARMNDLVRFSVADQGVGIPKDELEAVFDKFVQSSKTKTGAGGTGLGLSICREIVLAHKGRIWAENRPEGGAVFLFEIPLDLEPANKEQLAAIGADFAEKSQAALQSQNTNV